MTPAPLSITQQSPVRWVGDSVALARTLELRTTREANDDNGAVEEEANPIRALISDLRWQLEQMRPRGIQNAAGNPYNPSYYKKGLQNAIDQGGLAVADYVRGYLHKKPSEGYRKLEEANSLDLACEALIADEEKPYAQMFTPDERELARGRLAPYLAAIEQREADQRARIEQRRAELPADGAELTRLAASADQPEESIAINLAILETTPDDVVALNRLGRGYEAIGADPSAVEAFNRVLAIDPTNSVASRRLSDLGRRR